MDNTASLSGRKAEAARNDRRIREAARSIFMADPEAPMTAIAREAGVGVAALYRRYPSKEALLQQLFLDGLQAFLDEVQRALADPDDPRTAFRRFVHRSLDAGTGSLSYRFVGAFAFTPEMLARHRETDALLQQLVDRTVASGAMRSDVGMGDLQWLFMPTYAIQARDSERSAQLRHRHLAILLDGLFADGASPLPGTPPEGTEFGAFWEEQLAKALAAAAPPVSGRRAASARTDRRILTAARAVLMTDPGAPIAAIAERAGVGISVLYRRFPSKEALVQRVYLDGLNAALAELKRALADPDDPRNSLRRFVDRMLQAGIGSMPYHFIGTFPISPEMARVSAEVRSGFQQLTLRTQEAGALRPDVGRGDLESLFQPTYAIRVSDEQRSAQLRHRFLAIMLDGLQTPNPSALPGPPPEPEEFDAFWREKLATASKPGTPGSASGSRAPRSDRSPRSN